MNEENEMMEADPKMFEGIFRPGYCPRQRTDCECLSQIIAEGHKSFICCGQNDGTTRVTERDEFRVCFKNDVIDTMEDYDKKDLAHTASVLSQGLAIAMEWEAPADPTPEEMADRK